VSDGMWYFAQGSEQRGPVSAQELIQLAASGALTPQTLVWQQGMPNWVPAGTVPGLIPSPTSGAIPNVAAPPESLNYADTIPITAQNYAGFWLRFCAVVVDWIVVALPFLLIRAAFRVPRVAPVIGPNGAPVFSFSTFFPSGPLISCGLPIIEYVVWWLYFTLMESSERQATLGKLAVGLKVTDMMGMRISYARANGRFFGKIVSFLTFYIGFMMAGWTQRKQALHDLMAETLVLKK
jgi:uncharacterized RDD family membrane protein YckC